ncbi:carbohydrate ABC transporter permease [Buchananella hordeovulneris]|uniref:carbohydrate ABC transporter permease n=1 Tax=Buchananella hordeovulneris TaxID=52770 RepID=UPI000A0677F2|nr:carbohydrate ABC transporter permease [Buchananella hordeovulneris]MDO5080658.1 carbohydrate ABC transporter permease [Buchananella hordeovulneris]RRD42994.1 carbohydrate ABC transporter permease [Buchananella hordeovulneris]RRD51667.1 carbohydrate ABC transporter permease [Buchananella hordeovulneris]
MSHPPALALAPAERRRRALARRKSAVGWAIAAIYLFPVYWMVTTALKDRGASFASPPQLVPHAPTLASFEAAFSPEYGILLALGNSVLIAGGTLLVTLVVAVPSAYAVARFRDVVSTSMLVLLTVVQLLPAIAISIPMFVLFRQLDLINTHLSIILADVSVTLPFAVILLRPYFKQFPYEIEEAAKLDGLGVLGTIVRIVLPTIRPGIVMIGSFAFLMAWGEFTFALALSTKQEIQPLTVALNRLIGQYGTNWNDLMAVATLIAAPVLVIFIAVQRYIVAGLTGGATKG